MISRKLFSLGVVLAAAGLLSACERPQPDSLQQGYRGTGMVQVDNPRLLAARAEANVVPDP
jgi:photosynthetic reaction center cytochrome c subunit